MNRVEVRLLITVVDELMFSHAGEHLNDLERSILEGVLENQKYAVIAQNNHRSEKYIKDLAGKLWNSLSATLGEEVSKSNIKSILRRYYSSSISSTDKDKLLDICDHLPIERLQHCELLLSIHHEAFTKLVEEGLTVEQIATALELSLQLVRKQIQNWE